MTYRIGMWIVIALMVAQTSFYHLVSFPKSNALLDRYDKALGGAVVAMNDCSNLLDKMDRHIRTNCGQLYTSHHTTEGVTWNK